MAQRIVVRKTDDLDGAEASQTVRFELDGSEYEIDLTDAHAAELRAAVEAYTKAARRIGGVPRRATAASAEAAKDYDPKAVRAWAGSRHIELPARGRIPAAVVADYHAAGN